MEQRGQLDISRVLGIIGILVAIIVGGLVFTKVHEKTTESVEGLGTTYTDQTTNSAFTSDASGWENYVEGIATNAWNAGGYVTTTTTDNDAITDNGVWYQSITVSSLRDEVSSATANFKFRVIDNAGQTSIVVRALLSRPNDNVTLYSVTLTENTATWTSIENDIRGYITATGTYALYLRAELLGSGVGVSLAVGFDDADLTVNTYEKSVGEETATGIGDTAKIIFAILPILALVGIVFLLIWSFSGRSGT